jgi:hypothetical protein
VCTTHKFSDRSPSAMYLNTCYEWARMRLVRVHYHQVAVPGSEFFPNEIADG